jgi:hypothetical protein
VVLFSLGNISMRTTPFFFVTGCLFVFTNWVLSEDSNTIKSKPDEISLPQDDPRRDLKITLETDRKEYLLGENVIIHYVVKNTGKRTFYINRFDKENGPFFLSFGGDIRKATGRSFRFHVSMTDENGAKGEDPYLDYSAFGGSVSSISLEPGDEFCQSMQLLRYRVPKKAGTYMIRVHHDLGWGEEKNSKYEDGMPIGLHRAPIVSTTIRFVMPSPEQAQNYINAMLKTAKNPGVVWVGRDYMPFLDLALLRYPVYLPIARKMASEGDERGMTAIGEMPFPEATDALLELSESRYGYIAGKAMELLLNRVPNSPNENKFVTKNAWRDDVKVKFIQKARMFLTKEDRESQLLGGHILMQLGGNGDLQAFLPIFDSLLMAYQNDAEEQFEIIRPHSVCDMLFDIDCKLIERGAKPPQQPKTPGESLAFLGGLKVDPKFRPKGWQISLHLLLKDKSPFIRAIAAKSIPLPMTDSTADIVVKLFNDPSIYVQAAACKSAEKSAMSRFGSPLCELMKTANNGLVESFAKDAALKCGVQRDRVLELLVERLGARAFDQRESAFLSLIYLTVKNDFGYEWRNISIRNKDEYWNKIQKSWKIFIAENRQALREGRQFPAADPPMVKEMFPTGFQFHRKGITDWPDSKEMKEKNHDSIGGRSKVG